MDTKKTPLAVAVFMTIVAIFCMLSIAVFPETSRTIFGSWFHGIDFDAIWNPSFSVNSVIIGIVSAFVLSYIAAWVFVKIYKAIVK